VKDIISITCESKILTGNISLPASKSITNRALILKKLSDNKVELINTSTAEDSRILEKILTSSDNIADVGIAGTAMRFLTAYYAVQENKEVTLTGSERMKKRPIDDLVQALIALGAEISYTEKVGFPPLFIKGKKLSGGNLTIRGDISSQFISALLLISPALENGLSISISGETVSKPYIEMTLSLLKQCGANIQTISDKISMQPFELKPTKIEIEADWSAAAFFYQCAALSDGADIFLMSLKKDSLQGDAVLSEIFEAFGVTTTYLNDSILLKKNKAPVTEFNFDFTNCPDLAQSVAVTMAGLGIKGELRGLKTLKIKETDRILAIANELQKFGIKNMEAGEDFLIFKCSENVSKPELPVAVYDDHRMAMAFAPLALKTGEIKIEDSGVVKKSFPDYWKNLKEIGFTLDC
jgi:3-phosphoshikimate 1-carboxyvinyltransferase